MSAGGCHRAITRCVGEGTGRDLRGHLHQHPHSVPRKTSAVLSPAWSQGRHWAVGLRLGSCSHGVPTQVGGVTAPRAAALSADEPVLAGGVSRRHRAQREPELAGAACRGARHAPADTPSEGVWRAAPFQGAPVTPRLPSGHRTHSEAFSWRR